MNSSLRIRTKKRKELNLELARKTLSDMRNDPPKTSDGFLTSAALLWCICEDVIDALEAALSVERTRPTYGNPAYREGWQAATTAYRQAIGVIEEDGT